MIVLFSKNVKRHVSRYCQRPGFEGFYLIPLIVPVPDFYQCLLYNILCILLVERDAEGKPEELVFHWKYVGLETDILHLCSD